MVSVRVVDGTAVIVTHGRPAGEDSRGRRPPRGPLIYLNAAPARSSSLHAEGRRREKRPYAGSAMVRSVSADELLRSARHAAGTRNVREAVRDLTLHALRSRLLTATHIAAVARTVGEGIESSRRPADGPGPRNAPRGVGRAGGRRRPGAARDRAGGEGVRRGPRATHAGESASRCSPKSRRWSARWGRAGNHPRAVPAALAARIASVTSLLQASAGATVRGDACRGESARPAPSGILSFVASGVLLGLSEAPGDLPERLRPLKAARSAPLAHGEHRRAIEGAAAQVLQRLVGAPPGGRRRGAHRASFAPRAP